ncbi:hypothetical protein ACFXNW_29445 [Nocardia sp. NPDC059180]|uniref:hypothetical protein n=1 Tax=Nocardia sp. NPDC059180 TaxID=3346761 RepID=UPI0036BA3D09
MGNSRDSSLLRTPEELRVLYRLAPTVRDIFTEGRHDKRFVEHFLKNVSELDGLDYHVYAVSDRLNLPDGEVISKGYDAGERGRVLALATVSADWSADERRGLTCIADSDFAHLVNDVPSVDVLLLTDYASLEGFALTDRVLHKFLRVGLSLDEPTGAELLSKAIPLLNELYFARAALHWSSSGISVNMNLVKRILLSSQQLADEVVKRHITDGDMKSVLHRSLAELSRIRKLFPSLDDPRKAARGHDIAPVVITVLGLRNKWADVDTVERNLMVCVEHGDIISSSLFKKLILRIESSATQK